jgi:hypothetical protein
MAARHTPTAEVEMSVPASTDSAADAQRDSAANVKLEVVVLSVSDVDMVAEQTGEGLPS